LEGELSRAFLLVLDSVGIGSAPDASQYGDEGSHTIGHVAQACASRAADRTGVHVGRLDLPNLKRLGLGLACKHASGWIPPGLEPQTRTEGFFACAAEQAKGKDTPSGHWELAGFALPDDWHYFPHTDPAFTGELLEKLCYETGLPGTLGNVHASGTEIIGRLGTEHIRSGKPICYTSADSVFQIAAHEECFGLERLYTVCESARRILDPLRVGRVIARPFTGHAKRGFERTGNRRDYTMPPPRSTILAHAADAGRRIMSIGKIADIFAHRDTGEYVRAFGNDATMDRVIDCVESLPDGGLALANFNDFDTLYGHRRDVAGYARALEQFDARIPQLISRLRRGDLVLVTADHGCDPTWKGTDHTREYVPVIAFGPGIEPGDGGVRTSFADAGATIAGHLGLPVSAGVALWPRAAIRPASA
jgi:phosphopentomutase